MEITVERLKHSLAVANKMRALTMENPERYPLNSEDMFVLGMVHDLGYQFSEEQEEHARVGGELLKRQGYQFWKEVYYHGLPQCEYDSLALRLLNYADLITGPSGEQMTVGERIEDIAKRYGEDSRQVREARRLAEMIYEE